MIPTSQYRDRFDIFLEWLRDLGGKYQYLYDDTPPSRVKHEPTYNPANNRRALNPEHYYVDHNGSVRKKKLDFPSAQIPEPASNVSKDA